MLPHTKVTQIGNTVQSEDTQNTIDLVSLEMNLVVEKQQQLFNRQMPRQPSSKSLEEESFTRQIKSFEKIPQQG